MNCVSGRQNHAAPRRKGESNQPVACHLEASGALWRDFHNPALSGERSRNVHIACGVKNQALGASQAAVEGMHRALGIDFVHAIEA